MSDDLEYLQPDFDPSSLKVAQLRNIFVQYDIAYPSGAKKPELVDLFETKLRPKAKRLLAQAARVKRTSMGIEDMPSRESSIANGDLEEEDLMPEPTPVRRAVRKASATPSTASRTSRASRRSTRSAVEAPTDEEEDEEDGRTTRESTARASRQSTRTPMAESDVSESERPRTGRRKMRLSDFDTPSQVKEEPEDIPAHASVETPFSTHNPFQSGSSPTTAPSTVRRKSTTRKSQSRRRTADQSVQVKKEDREITPVPRSRQSGVVARLSNGKVKEDRSRTATVEPSEEFTPDEQLAMEMEEEETGKAVMPVRRKKPRSSAAKTGFWVVMGTVLATLAGVWRQEKIAAGFCGHSTSGQLVQLAGPGFELPEWASGLQPICDHCPQNAVCYQDYGVKCEPDYVLKHHPLSLNGLIPLPPTCEPDSEKLRRVQAVAEKAVEELREQKAKYECGDKDESGHTISSAELSEETLKAKVSAKRRRGMTEAEFEALWEPAIEQVIGREEVTQNSHGRPSFLQTSSLARLPIACTLRRSARLAVARYRVPLASIIAILLAAAYARASFRASRADRARVPGLVSSVLDRLATQAAIHADGRSPEPWISAGQLRDDVLRTEFSAARREKIWKRVQAVVELNANVRAGVKESRSGDVSRVWEWIGAVPALEDVYDRSASRSQSRSRLSYGERSLVGGIGEEMAGESRSPSAYRESPGIKREGVDGEREVRRWDEGRPAY